MENIKNETSIVPVNCRKIQIFDTVKRAIIQLNKWVTSIEQSLNVNISISSVDKDVVFNEIYEKMNVHYDRLKRIVQLSQDLSNQYQVDEMNLINEYIFFVKDRFEKLLHHVEWALRSNEVEIIHDKWSIVCGKITIYNNVIQSLFKIFHSNIANDADIISVKNQLKNFELTFKRYSSKVDRLKTIIKNTTTNLSEDFSDKLNSTNRTLTKIESKIDQKWECLLKILKPYESQTQVVTNEISELFSITKTMEEYFEDILQSPNVVVEILDNVQTVKIKNYFPILSVEMVCQNWKSDFEKILTSNKSIEYLSLCLMMTDKYCFNNRNYIKLRCEFRSMLTYTIYKSKPSRYNTTSKCTKRKRIYPLSCTNFSILMSKFPPSKSLVSFINSTVNIIYNNKIDTDSALYKNLLNFDKSYPSHFEDNYIFLKNQLVRKSPSENLMLNEQRPSNQIRDLSIPLASTDSSRLFSDSSDVNLTFQIRFLKTLSTSIGKANSITNKMFSCLLRFTKRKILFDISLGCLMVLKESICYLYKDIKLNQIIQNMFETNQYRLVPAPV